MNNCIHRHGHINSEVYLLTGKEEEKGFVKTVVASKECKRNILIQIIDKR